MPGRGEKDTKLSVKRTLGAGLGRWNIWENDPTMLRIALFFLLLLAYHLGFSQRKDVDQPGRFSTRGYSRWLKNFAYPFDKSLSKDPGRQLLVEPGVLNVILAKQASQYLSTSGDLNYARMFAVLDDADDRLSLGFNVTNNTNKERVSWNQLKWIFSAGMKADVSEKFAKFWDQDGPGKDIGVFGKITLLGTGSIWYYGDAQDSDVSHSVRADARWAYLKAESTKKADDAVDGIEDVVNDLGADTTGIATTSSGRVSYTAALKDTYTAARKGIQKELITDMAAVVMEEELYTKITGSWLTFEGYMPVTEKGYFVAASTAQGWYMERLARPMSASISGGYFRHYAGWPGKFQLRGTVRVWQNNSVAAELLDDKAFQTVKQRGGADSLQAVVDEEDVYIGAFERFASASFALRGVWLFPKFAGLSAEIEPIYSWHNMANADRFNLNWKLGIPLHYTNKEGDGKVTVELQLREQFKQHSVGLSIGVPIGAPVFE